MYYSLSLTNSILVIAHMNPLCSENLYPSHCSHSPFHRKMCILLLVRCHCPLIWPPVLPQILAYTLIVFLITVTGKPALYKLPTFKVPNLIFIFCHIGRLSREITQVQGSFRIFVTLLIFVVSVGSHPNPKLEATPCWLSLHLQPKDAPCCGAIYLFNMVKVLLLITKFIYYKHRYAEFYYLCLWLSKSKLSRQCGILNIPLPCRHSQPVTGIALLFYFYLPASSLCLEVYADLVCMFFQFSGCYCSGVCGDPNCLSKVRGELHARSC
jgi:hypothetical protein